MQHESLNREFGSVALQDLDEERMKKLAVTETSPGLENAATVDAEYKAECKDIKENSEGS